MRPAISLVTCCSALGPGCFQFCLEDVGCVDAFGQMLRFFMIFLTDLCLNFDALNIFLEEQIDMHSCGDY